MLTKLLRKSLISVDLAENGLSAIEMALDNGIEYDIVFMDGKMPVMVMIVHSPMDDIVFLNLICVLL